MEFTKTIHEHSVMKYECYINKDTFENEYKLYYPTQCKGGDEYSLIIKSNDNEDKEDRTYINSEKRIVTTEGMFYYLIRIEMLNEKQINELSSYCECENCKRNKLHFLNPFRYYFKKEVKYCIKSGNYNAELVHNARILKNKNI
jgi:hypothetical protein